MCIRDSLCPSCGTRQDTAQNTDGMTRLLLTKETEATPADFIADYRYVPLGTTRQPVGNIDQLLVTDDRIIVVDKERAQTVFIFDLNGNPCAEIYRPGRGPQEYNHIDHVTLTPGEKPQLAILDGRGNKVLFYDLEGRFVNSIPIPFRFTGMEYLNKDEILCFTDAYVRHEPFIKKREDANRLLFFTDNKFQIKASALTNRAKKRKISFTVPFVKWSGEELLVNPNMNDTIYRLDGHDLQPLYYVDKSALGSVLPTEDLTDEQIIELEKDVLNHDNAKRNLAGYNADIQNCQNIINDAKRRNNDIANLIEQLKAELPDNLEEKLTELAQVRTQCEELQEKRYLASVAEQELQQIRATYSQRISEAENRRKYRLDRISEIRPVSYTHLTLPTIA